MDTFLIDVHVAPGKKDCNRRIDCTVCGEKRDFLLQIWVHPSGAKLSDGRYGERLDIQMYLQNVFCEITKISTFKQHEHYEKNGSITYRDVSLQQVLLAASLTRDFYLGKNTKHRNKKQNSENSVNEKIAHKEIENADKKQVLKNGSQQLTLAEMLIRIEKTNK